jgi:modified peptide precursor CbpA
VRSAGALFVFRFEEKIMTQTPSAIPPAPTTPASAADGTAPPDAAPTIAVRKSCNPDGIGLSHYVLMDRKAAR